MAKRPVDIEDDFDDASQPEGFLDVLDDEDEETPSRRSARFDDDDDEPDGRAGAETDDEDEDEDAERFGMADDSDDDSDDDEEEQEPEERPAKKRAGGKAPARKASRTVEDDDEDNKPVDEVLPWLKKLKADTLEPEVIESITELGKEVVGIRRAQKKRDREDQARRDEETWSQFEAAVRESGDAENLGDGPTSRLKPGSKAHKARIRLMQAMARASYGYQATKEPVPAFGELFEQAYLATFGRSISTKAKKQATEELKRKVEKRSKQVMHVPSRKAKATASGRDAAQSPKARAMSVIKQFYSRP